MPLTVTAVAIGMACVTKMTSQQCCVMTNVNQPTIDNANGDQPASDMY